MATILLLAVLSEVMLMGSGRLLQVGPLTLRMWLYAISLVYAALAVLWRRRVNQETAMLLLAFAALTTTSSVVGLVNRAPIDAVLDDVKPLLFFLGLLFFQVAITDLRQVRRVAATVRACAVMLAAAYLGLLTLVLLRVIPFGLVYETLGRSDEFFFRGESGLFYKGFLYLGIGFCFFLVGRGWSKLVAALLFATIVLTLTRGLVLSAVIVLAVALLVRARGALRLPAYGLLLATGVALAAPWLQKVFEVRATSDALRLGDVRAVEQSTTWASVLLGHGLGIAVGQRARIEATYLEILHQQGVLGLCFWGAIAALLMRDYLRAWKARRDDIALPFFLGAVFVYVESATNPFLTNPIGMSMVLVSLVVLRLLARGPASIGQPATRGQRNLAPGD